MTQPKVSSVPTLITGGRIKNFLAKWQEITSDRTILSIVQGYKLEFYDIQPVQLGRVRPTILYTEAAVALDQQIQNFLSRGIIVESQHESTEFISPVFLRAKKNGSFRMILNLKEFNRFITYHHFKMDNIETCVHLMKPGCFMASIDLSDAYFSVPVDRSHQKYLKFLWKGKLYQFTCLAQGLACAPRVFTKLLKPVYAYLRLKGHVSSGYLDDSFLEGDTSVACSSNVQDTLTLLGDLGFCPNLTKSVVQPTQILEHLGFILNSLDMSVSITDHNFGKLLASAHQVLQSTSVPVRLVARLVGIMVSFFPGVEYARLFYRQLEIEKSTALKNSNWNFESPMMLSETAKNDIVWWMNHAKTCKRKISHGKITRELKTDASTQGWGAFSDGISTGGRWSPEEAQLHINALELLAVFWGLKALCPSEHHCHIKVLSDNTTTVSYLRNMGGSHSTPCNDISRDIWLWCKDRDIWITPAHIPGVENIEADSASRVFNDKTEWKLDQPVVSEIFSLFGKPDLDLFASRLNHQLSRYVSWIPDPNAVGVDAFTLDWGTQYNYAFPPFSLISQVLQKVEEDQAEAIMIAPHWPTQSWFPKLTRLLVQTPVLLPNRPNIVHLPFNPGKEHPLGAKLLLMACHLSGKVSKIKAFQRGLKSSFCSPGGKEPRNSTEHTYSGGPHSAVDGILIPFNQLYQKS